MLRWLLQLFTRARDDRAPEGARSAAPEPAPGQPDDGEADRAAPGADDVVVMPIEDAIDLHTFAPRDMPSVVEEYLNEAWERGFEEVRIIHGRGKGVQRRIVQGVLSRHPAVESYRDAPASRGGWGATVAWLKPRR